MQSTKDLAFLSHPPDTLDKVRRTYNIHQPGRIEESIDRLQEWIRAQPHFNKKDFDKDILEMFVVNNKGSVEKAKQRLERHCAIKTFGKKFYTTDTRVINLKELDNLYCAVLPKLTKEYHRVYFIRNSMEIYGPNVIKNFVNHTIHIFEFLLKHNYCLGTVLVFDWRKADLYKLVTTMANPDALHGLEIFLKGYQMRVHGIHFVTTSKLVETLLSVIKSVVSPKILSRVVIHKDIETLYDHIDKDLLPSEYGGKEKSLEELATDMNKYLSTDEYVEYCRETFKATIDTSKKPKNDGSDDFHGMAGTFRTIQID